MYRARATADHQPLLRPQSARSSSASCITKTSRPICCEMPCFPLRTSASSSISGFDPIGIVRSAWVDVRSRKNAQGASTLSMQLARDMFLTPERSWRRKLAEITDHPCSSNRKLTKEQIFEMYFESGGSFSGYRGKLPHHSRGSWRIGAGIFREGHPVAQPAGSGYTRFDLPRRQLLQPLSPCRTAFVSGATPSSP